MTTVKRTIFFHQINCISKPDVAESPIAIVQALARVKTLNESRHAHRFMNLGTGALCIRDINFHPDRKRVQGKIILVRDDFPELLNRASDEMREIEAAETEGVAETAHFMIDYRDGIVPRIAIESTQSGPKIQSFLNFVRFRNENIIQSIDAPVIVNNVLESIGDRMARISTVQIRSAREAVQLIDQIDSGIGTACRSALDLTDADYADILIKIDYRQRRETNKAIEFVRNVVNAFRQDTARMNAFDLFKVKAEDRQKNGKLNDFDLLSDRRKADVRVELRGSRSKCVSSTDMFDKLDWQLNLFY